MEAMVIAEWVFRNHQAKKPSVAEMAVLKRSLESWGPFAPPRDRLIGAIRMAKSVHDSWSIDQEGAYRVAIQPWDDKLCLEVAYYIQNHVTWRPTVDELNRIGVRLLSKMNKAELPNVGELFGVFWKALCTSSVPQWVHPIMGRIVTRLGGWDHLVTLNPHLSAGRVYESWYDRFQKAFEVEMALWVEDVVFNLQTSDGLTNPFWFPPKQERVSVSRSRQSGRNIQYGDPQVTHQEARKILESLKDDGTIIDFSAARNHMNRHVIELDKQNIIDEGAEKTEKTGGLA